MAHRSAGVETGLGVRYCRHRPEDPPLYQIIERYYPLFEALRAEQGRAFCLSAVAQQHAMVFQMTAGNMLKRKENTLGWLGR